MVKRTKLPIGIQSFEKLREDGYLYVDKTAYVYGLAKAGVPYFLSRPRRFGKSLLVSTMRAYFEGRRELFEGLEIERLEGNGPDAWQPHAVFHFDFNGADYTRDDALAQKLDVQLARWEESRGIVAEGGLGDRFACLLAAAHEQTGRRCVVLVDEYDKPLLDAMDDPALLERNRMTFKSFFGVLKSADEHLRFAFITGVTKFSKVSIFSDLNQLNDISLNRDYASVCGITEEELVANFDGEVGRLAEELGLARKECMGKLRTMYDGYCFHPASPGVYNPFSLLRCFFNRDLGSYWFESGTPTFLVRRLRETHFDVRKLTDGTLWAAEARVSDYRADDPDPVPLLYQSGYLTIKDFDAAARVLSLGVPNGEVERGLAESLLADWAPASDPGSGKDVYTLRARMLAGDTDGMRDVFFALFASIPYTREADPFENYFQTVIYLVFTLLGQMAHVEMHAAVGRVDCVTECGGFVYLFEFKRDGTAAEALAQIDARGYAAPYAADPRELVRIGAAFESGSRMLADWEARR